MACHCASWLDITWDGRDSAAVAVVSGLFKRHCLVGRSRSATRLSTHLHKHEKGTRRAKQEKSTSKGELSDVQKKKGNGKARKTNKRVFCAD
jgi:hypothetical protein